MSQPAIFVVTDGDDVRVYRGRYGAIFLESALILGPEKALETGERWDHIGDQVDEWWCEAAVLVDTRRRVLLWYGGDYVRYDAASHRYFHELLSVAWAGWQVRWAVNEIHDLADHVGQAVSEQHDSDHPYGVSPSDWSIQPYVQSAFYPPSLVTRGSRRSGYEVALSIGYVGPLSRRGASLLDDPIRSLDDWNLPVVPFSGIHMDTEVKRLFYWCPKPLRYVRRDLGVLPEGWTTGVVEDGLQGHVKFVPGLTVPWPDRQVFFCELMGAMEKSGADESERLYLEALFDWVDRDDQRNQQLD